MSLPTLNIRLERPEDAEAIGAVIEAAFRDAPHRSGTEAMIVRTLRDAGALTVSLIALQEHEVVAHLAFSPITIAGEPARWFGLGPVSVHPDLQGKGVGQALIRQGLHQLRSMGADGSVVLGDPAYYSRFGFETDPELRYGGAPREYFQRLSFEGPLPKGEVAYHPAFGAS